MLKFLHSSDWQLGAGFGQMPGDKGALLRAERLAAIERIGKLAQEHDVRFILVAGDVFDAHTVDNDVVTRALEVISRFSVPVYAIPGNHDFAAAPESVYQRDRYRERCPDNLHLLTESKPVELSDMGAALLPCPLVQRHTVSDPTRWLASEAANTDDPLLRIAIAHGSVVDFESEEGGTTPNLIGPTVVEDARLDYLALGDWHGVRRVNDRAWYSGTPEPDRFKQNDSGHVLLVSIEDKGTPPLVTSIPSAGCQWLRHDASLHDEADLTALERWFADLENAQKTLVRLEIDGVLGMEGLERLERLLETQSELLLHLRQRGLGVQLKPLQAELDSLDREGLTGRVAEALRRTTDGGGDDAKNAGLALQMLFQRARRQDAEGTS